MTQENKTFPDAVSISLGERSYNILIGSDLINHSAVWKDLPQASVAVVVSNDIVFPLFGADVVSALEDSYARVVSVILPDGEAFKNWQTLQLIFDALLENCCDRKTVLFALGGGVVGDMTGFAAASYMRGIPFVQIPTTLLAQVDSSVVAVVLKR